MRNFCHIGLSYFSLVPLVLLYTYGHAYATLNYPSNPDQLRSIIEDGVVKTIQYDQNGNISFDDQANHLTYDSDDELIKVLQTNGNTIEYRYDALNQQMAESFNQSEPLYHFYQDRRILDDVQVNDITHYFEHGQLSVTNNQIKASYYLQNNFGSVVTLIDQSQQLAHFYRYLPFGYQSDMKPDSATFDVFDLADSSKGYNDMLTDQVTGNQFLGSGYRGYSPRLRLFMKYDSLSPFDQGGINGYAYSDNNPIMAFDPSGHMSKWQKIDMGIGLGLTAIASALAIMATGGAATPAVVAGYTSTLSAASIGVAVTTPVIADSIADAGTGKNWTHQMRSTGWKNVVVGLGTLAAGEAAGYGIGQVTSNMAAHVIAKSAASAIAQESLSIATGLQKGVNLQNFGINFAANAIIHTGIHASMPREIVIPRYNGKSLNFDSMPTFEEALATTPIPENGLAELNDNFNISKNSGKEPLAARKNFYRANIDKFSNAHGLTSFENMFSFNGTDENFKAVANWAGVF
ncbi:RHS repeat-associated core domain-containing protein [Cysteiniphilum sp. QT6929]|uniref:RHS repeat domain-containing protein n=1 Tax=Cysteiniphilum sp. QT6929 TaxID=2975055 RepID=UPI0024B3AC27|nr:RHS repeat-associated core domain-containing protein [Cysteiniphilum sp. QT6929]WHN66299.1 hypothetical protein NYP54_03455 [Cysteiniphilum sp. QT6929]